MGTVLPRRGERVLVGAQHAEGIAHTAYKPLPVFTKAVKAPQG